MIGIRLWSGNVKVRRKTFLLAICLLFFLSATLYNVVEGKNKRRRRRGHSQKKPTGEKKEKTRQGSKVKSTSEIELLKILESADALDGENKAEKAKKVKQLQKAYVFFKEWRKQIGPDTAYGLGRRLLEHDDNVEAEDAFVHALKAVPNSPDAKLSLGIAQLQQGTYLSAVKATSTLGHIQQKSMGTFDRLSISQYMFAESLRQSFQYSESIKVYEKFMSIKSNVTKDKDVLQDAITNYFSACLESGEKPKLDVVRILCSKLKSFRCYEHLGGWYMRINKEKNGKKYFRKAVELAGPKFKSFFERDKLLFPTGKVALNNKRLLIEPAKVLVQRDFLTLDESDGLADILDWSIERFQKAPRRICYKSGTAPNDFYPYLYKDRSKTGYDCLNQTVDILDTNTDTFSKTARAHIPGYSTSIFIDKKNIELVAKIEHRIYQMFGLNNRDGWPMQLLKYPTDVGYAAHTDCTMERLDPLDRSFTVLIYLNHIRSGGSTKFPALHKEVNPERGTAVVFSSLDSDGHCSPTMIHEGMKVLGRKPKYILQKWYRRSGHGRRYSRSNYFSFHRDVRERKEPKILCDLSKSCREYIPVDYDAARRVHKEL